MPISLVATYKEGNSQGYKNLENKNRYIIFAILSNVGTAMCLESAIQCQHMKIICILKTSWFSYRNSVDLTEY